MSEFNLDESIRTWRCSLASRGALSGSDLDELERQVRQEATQLIADGLSVREAFQAAVQRLSGPPTLQYASPLQQITDRHRLFWMLAGVLAWLLIGSVANLAMAVAMIGGAFMGLPGASLGIVAAGVRVVVFVTLVILGWSLWRSLSARGAHSSAGRLAPLLIVAALLLPLFALADRFAWPFVYAQLAGVGEMGAAAQVQAIANLAWSVVVPLVLVVMILSLLRNSHVRWR